MLTYTTATTSTTWNGPICGQCGARYLDSHACTRDDLQRRIDQLRAMQDAIPRTRVETPEFEIRDKQFKVRDTSTCPCRPENGGSGVCGCILSGPRITC